MDFTGKTIIITGASAGIGRALAIALSQKGSNVALAARNEAGLQDTANLCRQSGGKPLSLTPMLAIYWPVSD